MKSTRKLATLSLSVALAMVLSFVESQIPAFVAIPGVKIGLANIAVIFALYKLGWKEAVAVSIVRVFLVSLLFGSFLSLLYSLAGAVLSLSVMLILKGIKVIGKIGVSVCGGVCHNIGQIIMASIVMETNVIVYYLPFLLLSGTVAGIAIGLASALLVERVKL